MISAKNLFQEHLIASPPFFGHAGGGYFHYFFHGPPLITSMNTLEFPYFLKISHLTKLI